MQKPRNINVRTHFIPKGRLLITPCGSTWYLYTRNTKAVTCLKCLKALFKSYPSSSSAKADMGMRIGLEYANRIKKKYWLTKTQGSGNINSTLNSGGSHGSKR